MKPQSTEEAVKYYKHLSLFWTDLIHLMSSKPQALTSTGPKAVEILEKAKKLGIAAGKDPMGIAAAALYLSCISTGEVKSQKEISMASGVTEVTIRNRCAGLRKMIQEEKIL